MKNNSLPWYTQLWLRLQQFPGVLATGSKTPPPTSGVAAAALMSAAIGAATMMVTHHLSDADKSKVTEKFVHSLGYWIPGSNNPDPIAGNIGSYSGKETVLLVGWLVSWAILHRLLKNRQVSPRTIFLGTFGVLVTAVVMCWHPLFPYLPLQ